jgi:N6-L-threonylcarbamoyladenine synthase
MAAAPLILALDTSCDDTAAAVTRGRVVLSNVVASQVELHKQYGGVFPTVAKLAHREQIAPVALAALKRARVRAEDIDLAAVTQGRGWHRLWRWGLPLPSSGLLNTASRWLA